MTSGWLVAASVALLMVGNSYTARNQLDAQVEQRLENTVAVDQAWVDSITIGGARWVDHAALLKDPESALSRAASARAWDTWVLQEQSQVRGFPQEESEWTASSAAVLELANAASVAGANPHLFLTWGRRLGDARNPTLYPDYLTMQDRLTEGYLAAAQTLTDAGHTVGVAPVGEAFRQVYLDDLAKGEDPEGDSANFSRLYSMDGSHPSIYGTLLASAVMEASLVGRVHALPATKAVADDLTFAAYLDEVSRALVLDEPFGDFDYPWATRWDGRDVVEVVDVVARPALAFASEATLTSLGVGGVVDGVAGDGVAWMLAGAQVSTERLSFGVGGDNALVLAGGSLSVGEWALGDGKLLLRSGQLTVSQTNDAPHQLVLDWEAGVLQVSGGVRLDIAMEQPVDGTLRLDAGAQLGIETGSFLGRVEILSVDGEAADVLMASRLMLDDASVEVPEGYVWEVITRGDEEVLRVRVGDPSEPSQGTPGGSAEAASCGCTPTAPSGLVLWPLVTVLLGIRRRGR